ncbi:MAG: AsmA family protein [Pseudomonadota bacterium]
MGRIIKFLLYLAGGVIALGIVAAIAIAVLFDPNDYKDDIALAVKEQTGRDLAITGDLELSVFPWVAIQVGETELSNGSGFGDEPFARFDAAKVGVRLLPLVLGGNVEAGTISLDGLNLNLAVNSAGRTNWQDFLDAADASATEGDSQEIDDDTRTARSVSGFNVAGIEVTNTTLRYADATTDTAITLSELDMVLGTIATADNQLTVDGLDIRGLLEGATTVPTSLGLQTDGVNVDLESETLQVEPLSMALLGLDVLADVEPMAYGDDVATTANIQVEPFSLRSLMERLDIEPPPTADPAALGRVSLSGQAQLFTHQLSLVDVQLELDDSTFTGDLAIPRGDGAFEFALSGDSINLDNYMAPVVEAEAGAADADAAPVDIPVELLRLMDARGTLDMTMVSLAGIDLEEPEIHLALNNGNLRLHPITATVFNGEYYGDVRVNASGSTPVLSLNERIEGVELGALAKAMFDRDNITGAINGEFRLSGRGADLGAVQRSLTGNLSMNLLDGTFEGTDIWYELRKAYAVIKQQPAPEPVLPARTRFSNVAVSGAVTDGILQSDDLAAELPFMRLTGEGKVNLVEGTVDYRLNARVIESPELMGEDISADDLEALTRRRIPIKVSGDLASPSIRPDTQKLIEDRAKEEVENVVKDKLKDLFDR